jgi:hypothetical protein
VEGRNDDNRQRREAGKNTKGIRGRYEREKRK